MVSVFALSASALRYRNAFVVSNDARLPHRINTSSQTFLTTRVQRTIMPSGAFLPAFHSIKQQEKT